jgi:tetratricopeptide (TPR) repeat protein
MDQRTEALAHIKKGINIDPNRGTFWFILGDIQLKLGSFQEAEESYLKVIEFEPDNEDIWVFFTNLLLQLDRKEEAYNYIQESFKYHPGHARLTFQAAEIEMHRGNVQEACILAEIAFSVDPEMGIKTLDELPRLGIQLEVLKLIDRYREKE